MVAESRHDEHVILALGDHLDRLVIGVGGVLEHVDVGLGAELDAVHAANVRGDLTVALVRLVDGHLDLLQGVHRLLGRHAGPQQALARHVELDDVAAFLDVLANGATTSSTPSAKIARPSMPSFQKLGFQSSIPDVAQTSRPEAAMRGPGMIPRRPCHEA